VTAKRMKHYFDPDEGQGLRVCKGYCSNCKGCILTLLTGAPNGAPKLLLMAQPLKHRQSDSVPNSVTLNDLERRNSPNRGVIPPNSVTFGTDYVKVVEDTPILFAAKP